MEPVKSSNALVDVPRVEFAFLALFVVFAVLKWPAERWLNRKALQRHREGRGGVLTAPLTPRPQYWADRGVTSGNASPRQRTIQRRGVGAYSFLPGYVWVALGAALIAVGVAIHSDAYEYGGPIMLGAILLLVGGASWVHEHRN
jgi:hypothetical protein